VAGVALLLMQPACGGGEETRTFSVRAQVVRVVDGGRSLVVDHEDIPGYMDAMQMTLRVQDAAASEGLERGDKVRVQLFVQGGDAVVGILEKLPDATELQLAERPAGG